MKTTHKYEIGEKVFYCGTESTIIKKAGHHAANKIPLYHIEYDKSLDLMVLSTFVREDLLTNKED